MEYKVRNGYVLVKSVPSAEYELAGSFMAGQIVVGPDADLGVVVFFQDYDLFNTELMLVKTEDVSVWIKPDVVVEAPVEVVASSNEQQSN